MLMKEGQKMPFMLTLSILKVWMFCSRVMAPFCGRKEDIGRGRYSLHCNAISGGGNSNYWSHAFNAAVKSTRIIVGEGSCQSVWTMKIYTYFQSKSDLYTIAHAFVRIRVLILGDGASCLSHRLWANWEWKAMGEKENTTNPTDFNLKLILRREDTHIHKTTTPDGVYKGTAQINL